MHIYLYQQENKINFNFKVSKYRRIIFEFTEGSLLKTIKRGNQLHCILRHKTFHLAFGIRSLI